MEHQIESLIKDIDEKRIEQLNTKLINQYKYDILEKLQLTKKELNNYHKTLKNYRYVDEIDELKVGCYIRWFNINNLHSLKLYNGGILTDIENINNKVILKCKNFKNRFFKVILNECIVFQKLTDEELFLIKVFSYIKDI